MNPLTFDLSFATLRNAYAAGSATPHDVVARIYRYLEQQPLHPVWLSLVPRDQALARARRLPDGPLWGVPFAVKDNIDVAGLPTTAACPAFAYTPAESAFVVRQLETAGAILIGKTNMDQFATGLVGVRSPHGACASVFNERYISGGSSSGSAVSVARGLVSFSLGTDTAGSGRVPAACNNLVGLKPSRGLLSASGVVPACRSLDCVSIFALSCADAAAVFAAARAFDAGDPYARTGAPPPTPGPLRTRVGIPRSEQLQFFGDAETEALYRQTVDSLHGLGFNVRRFDLSPFLEAAQLLYSGPYVAERYAAIGAFAEAHQHEMDPTVASIILGARRFSAADGFQAQYRLQQLMRDTAATWQQVDCLLLPTAGTTYRIADILGDPVQLNSNLGYYTNFVNLLDLCAIAVPAGFTAAGLPFGVSAIAPAFAEHWLIEVADAIHRACFPSLTTERYVAPAAAAPDSVLLSVVGAHLTGQPLNHQLTSRGARLVETTRLANHYRCYALTQTRPLKPGLIRDPSYAGPGIETELWSVPGCEFGSFVAAVPSPLGIGNCELVDGRTVKGFICEPYAIVGMPEITAFRGWRAYLQSIQER